jgi:hypothetical protein
MCSVVIFVNYVWLIVYNFENVFKFETTPPLSVDIGLQGLQSTPAD